MLISRQFILFISVGITCALIDISTTQVLVRLDIFYGFAVSIGFAIGLIANYVLHAKLTFRAISSKVTVGRYAVVVGINYLITIVFAFFSVQMFGGFLVGKVASLPVIAVNGFLLSRYWVFR